MSAPTLALTDDYAYVITLFRDGVRVKHVFKDHMLSLHKDVGINGFIYYIIAHDYGTGVNTLLDLANEDEFNALNDEINRDFNDARSFKTALYKYLMQV